MSATAELPDINRMSLAALTEPSERQDWSEGYGETWEVIEPSPHCGYCNEPLTDHNLISINVTGTKYADDPLAEPIGATVWLRIEEGCCRTLSCSNFTERYEDEGDHFPIYNERYGLPTTRHYDTEDADKLNPVSLTIVSFDEGEKYYLALTGCGMDMTWDIAKGYMLLGFLPPVAFCDLPKMAGSGESEEDRWVIAGCKRALSVEAESLTRIIGRLNEF